MPIVTKPQTKEDLFKIVKTKLGEPVIRVSVAEEQMEVRLQEAIDMFDRFHVDATERKYVGMKVTQEDVDRGFLIAPEGVMDVIRALAFDGRMGNNNDGLLWFSAGGGMNAPFTSWMGGGGPAAGFGSMSPGVGPFGLNNAIELFLGDMQTAFFDNILFPEDVINYNTLTRRLNINVRKTKLKVDNYIVVEAMVSLAQTAEDYKYVLKSDWLKRMFTALVGYQWGVNLSKFSGGTLFGGDVQVDGKGILARYEAEVEDLRKELEEKWTLPAGFIIG